MRKIASVFLAVLILIGLCGCGSGGKRAEMLQGTWECQKYFDGDAMLEVFVHMDLYEEEIALLDPAGIGYVESITFRPDMTYTIGCDTEQSVALAEQYFRDAMNTFYEHREELNICYGVSFGVMDQDNFNQFYANLYGVSDYEALIDMFVESTVDPAYLEEGTEHGVFRVTGRRIYCTADGESQSQYIPYSFEDDVLTLGFYLGDVEYTRKMQ